MQQSENSQAVAKGCIWIGILDSPGAIRWGKFNIQSIDWSQISNVQKQCFQLLDNIQNGPWHGGFSKTDFFYS